MAGAYEGAACVVSALNGVCKVMIGRQGVPLQAALRAGVPRFVPSDFWAHIDETRRGDKGNFDLRREFMTMVDPAPIRANSILDGAFMDRLGHEMPIIRPKLRRVINGCYADRLLDFTTKDDVAAYVAKTALDEAAPRILCIAGDSVSARDIDALLTEVTGLRHRILGAGRLGARRYQRRQAARAGARRGLLALAGQAIHARPVSGRGKLSPLDNARYPNLAWISVRAHLASLVPD